MTRYGLKKIWDFRRSGDTFTYIHTIQLYLQGTRRRFTQRARGSRPTPAPHLHTPLGPGTASTASTDSTPARSEALRSPINICTTRSRRSIRRFGGRGRGRRAAGLDNTGEPRRGLRAPAAGAAASRVHRRARRRTPAQRPVQPQARQRQRQRAHARQPWPASARLARLLLAAPAVVEERLHAAHARRVVDARFRAAEARAAEPARRQRPRPRALLAPAAAAGVAHNRFGRKGAGAPLAGRGGRLRRHRLEGLVRARVRTRGRAVHPSRRLHVSVALALALGSWPQQRYGGLARARRPVDARRRLGRPGRRRRPAILIHRVRLTALRAVAFLFPHRLHLFVQIHYFKTTIHYINITRRHNVMPFM